MKRNYSISNVQDIHIEEEEEEEEEETARELYKNDRERKQINFWPSRRCHGCTGIPCTCRQSIYVWPCRTTS